MDHLSKLEAYIAEIERDAYARGRADTIRDFNAALEKIAGIVNELRAGILPTISADDISNLVAQQQRKVEPRSGSDQARVLDDIRAHPGSRGVDVANRLDGVKERTVRTALHRLKARRAIFKEGDQWFPAQVPESEEGQMPDGT